MEVGVNPLTPGTKVVALVSTSSAAAILAVIVALIVVGWRMRIGGLLSWLALLLAAGVGVALTRGAAGLLFTAGRGEVRVVAAGPAALPATLAGAIVAGVLVSGTVLLAVWWLPSATWSASSAALVAVAAIGSALLVAVVGSLS
jgi:hypothetical protein